MSNDLSTDLYLQYLAALYSAIKLPGDPQVISPYQVWDWGGTQGSMAGLTYAQYQALNQVPISPGNDSSTWGSEPGFDAIYNTWLTAALNPNPGQSDPQYQQLQNAVNQATIALSGAQQTAFTNYSNFAASSHSTETYMQWLQNEGATYAVSISTAQSTLTNAQNALNGYLASKTSVIQAAVAAYKSGLSFITN